jgi:hypothetical protein
VAIYVIGKNVLVTERKVVVVVPNVVVQIYVKTVNVVRLRVLAVAVNVRARPRAQLVLTRSQPLANPKPFPVHQLEVDILR